MRMFDLFSGIGGFALAAQWVWGDELEIVSFCEIDKFCQKVLKKHWPDVPICEDIKKFDLYVEKMREQGVINDSYSDCCENCSTRICPRDCGQLRRRRHNIRLDIITSGYPCQPFSTASHGRIIADDLSPSAIRIIQTWLPRFALFENVQRRTIENTGEQLQNIGYNTNIMRVSADEVGADHKRNRWWLVAHPYNESKFQSTINAKMAELQKIQNYFRRTEYPAGIFRASNGISDRVDRLKSLGNSIVPQVAEVIFRAIKEIDDDRT